MYKHVQYLLENTQQLKQIFFLFKRLHFRIETQWRRVMGIFIIEELQPTPYTVHIVHWNSIEQKEKKKRRRSHLIIHF